MRKEISYMRMAVMNTAGEEHQVCMNILSTLERKYKTRRKLNKIRIVTLKAITLIAGFLFLIGICSVDSQDITIPAILILASGLWLALMSLANN